MKKTLLTALALAVPLAANAQWYPKISGDDLISMRVLSPTEFVMEYDTDNDGISDVMYGYKITSREGNVYGIEIVIAGIDRNKDGKFEGDELYFHKLEEMIEEGKKTAT